MLSPAEVGYDLTLYAQIWLEERIRLTCGLAEAVAEKPGVRAVHDVRVACRRLREAIEFFRGVPEVPALTDVDRAARALARSVRRLRELDVAQKRLEKLETSDAEGAEVRAKLARAFAKRRKKARRSGRRKIEKRAAEFVTAANENLPLCDKPRAAPADRARESHLLAFVDARVAEKRALVESLFDDLRSRTDGRAAARADRLHAVRVAIKHWRYAGEIARAVMPRVLYRPMASRLRALQEMGGKSQDLSDLERLTREELGHAGTTEREGRKLLAAIRALRRDAAGEFVEALGARLPAAEAANAG